MENIKPRVPSGKLEFCLNETKKALERIRVLDEKAEELLKFARDYYNDAVHYKEADPATSLEAVAYAHGFIDACVLLGLAEIPGYHLTKKE